MTDRELNLLRELLETLERDEGACYKDRSHCSPPVRSGWQESSTAISACRAFSHGALSG